MSNKTYDILKTVALIAVPLFAFIGSLCTIWGIPYSEQITATLTALDTFIGALLIIASKQYNAIEPMDITDLEYIEDGEDE